MIKLLHALETGSGSDAHIFAHAVRVSVNETPGPSSRSAVSVGEEMRRNHGGGRGRCRGHVHRGGLRYRALVPGTTESLNVLLVASEYWRWAALLQADNVTTETETEIARVLSGHLLRGYVYLAPVSVSLDRKTFLRQ
jgi:hypothetical protein